MSNIMKCSDVQVLKFIENAIYRTENAVNWEQLEAYSANARGFVFGLDICGFLDDDNLVETMSVSYWEERNIKAYSTGASNVCSLSKLKL